MLLLTITNSLEKMKLNFKTKIATIILLSAKIWRNLSQIVPNSVTVSTLAFTSASYDIRDHKSKI